MQAQAEGLGYGRRHQNHPNPGALAVLLAVHGWCHGVQGACEKAQEGGGSGMWRGIDPQAALARAAPRMKGPAGSLWHGLK